jgi:inositol phosphorylceramide mannosyltransferase catalytic subunit
MPIPKVIYQTYATEKLPLLTRWHIRAMKKNNPGYIWEFYDDERIERFIQQEFSNDFLALYRRIAIGAAKADVFRYAILYKQGGVYLDIDSLINGRLDDFLTPADDAVLSAESNRGVYVQWALMYGPGHPFLKRTLERVFDNLAENRFPNDVHKMTGPTAYTAAVNECLAKDPGIQHRFFGVDYNGFLTFSYPLSKFFLSRINGHWKKQQRQTPVLSG